MSRDRGHEFWTRLRVTLTRLAQDRSRCMIAGAQDVPGTCHVFAGQIPGGMGEPALLEPRAYTLPAAHWPQGCSLVVRIVAPILRMRSGSAIASISTILPALTVKPTRANCRPPTVTTTPAEPLTSAGCNWERSQQCLSGNGICAADYRGGRWTRRAKIGPKHHVGVEHCDKPIEFIHAHALHRRGCQRLRDDTCGPDRTPDVGDGAIRGQKPLL